MSKPKILVPAAQEVAQLHPIVQLLLADCHEHFVNVNEVDVRAVFERVQRARDGAVDLELEDLFGEPYFVTEVGLQHVISVHRGFARHVPARSDVFDIETFGALPLDA